MEKYREALQNTENATAYDRIKPNAADTCDCDPYCDCYSDSGGSENEPPQVENSPPPQFLQIIKDTSKQYGFTLDDALTAKIIQSGVPHDRFTCEHSFFEYAAQKVKQKYLDKPADEQKLLFVRAFEWPDFRDDYPAWRETQREHALIFSTQKRRENPPRTCAKCGSELYSRGGTLLCEKCGAMYDFDNVKGDWVFTDYQFGRWES